MHDYGFPFLVRKGNYWALRRLKTYNQNKTVAARAIADMKTFGHLS